MAGNRHTEPTSDQLVLRWATLLPSENPGVNAAFATFVRWSPENLKTFLQHKVLTAELQRLDKECRIDVAPLIARVRNRGNVIPWPGLEARNVPRSEVVSEAPSQRASGRAATAMILVTAALVLLLVLFVVRQIYIGGSIPFIREPENFRVDRGE